MLHHSCKSYPQHHHHLKSHLWILCSTSPARDWWTSTPIIRTWFSASCNLSVMNLSCVFFFEAINDYVFTYRFMWLPQLCYYIFLQWHTNSYWMLDLLNVKSKMFQPCLHIDLSNDINPFKSYPSYFSNVCTNCTLWTKRNIYSNSSYIKLTIQQ